MTLFEYLRAKYRVATPTTITKAEAKIFGFAYPLRSAWLSEHGDKEVTPAIRDRLVASMTSVFLAKTSEIKSAYAGRALEALGVDLGAVMVARRERSDAAAGKKKRLNDPIEIRNCPEFKAAARAAQQADAANRKAKNAARRAAAKLPGGRSDPVRLAERAAGRADRRDLRVACTPRAPALRPASVPHAYRGSPEECMRAAEARTKIFVAMSAVDPASPEFLSTNEWAFVRMQALEGFKRVEKFYCHCCMTPPSPGAPMNVDHIKPRKFFPELALEISNLQLLCPTCNLGKANWSQTDWRDGAHATKSA